MAEPSTEQDVDEFMKTISQVQRDAELERVIKAFKLDALVSTNSGKECYQQNTYVCVCVCEREREFEEFTAMSPYKMSVYRWEFE